MHLFRNKKFVRGGPPIVSGSTPATVQPTIQSLTRDHAAAGGGSVITAFGLQMSGVTMSVGVTQATVLQSTSTMAAFTVPAKSVSTYDVSAYNGTFKSTLTASLAILPSPTTTYAAADPVANTSTWDSVPTRSTLVTRPGRTHAYQCNVPDPNPEIAGFSFLDYKWAVKTDKNPPRNNANGLYVRWYAAYDQATIDSIRSGGQIKMFLNRLFKPVIETPVNPWWVLAGGFLSGGDSPHASQLIVLRDDGNQFSGGTFNGSAFTDSRTSAGFVAATFREYQVWMRQKDDTVAYQKLWIDGNLVSDITGTPGNGSATGMVGCLSSSDTDRYLDTQIGIAYGGQGVAAYPLIQYVDSANIADGYIDP